MKLSIGQAWDESKAIFRADGGAILAIALALTVLPGAILETAAPASLRTAQTPWWIGLLGLMAALLSLTSQLAISRIALGPSTTVGEALALAFRRVPALFGALLLAILPFALAFTALRMTVGEELTPAKVPASVSVPLLLVTLVGIYVLIRLLFLTAVTVDQRLGPVALLKEAWRLTSGRLLKLLGLILLLTVVAVLVLGALGGALSAVVIVALGAIEPGNVSALLVALIQQALAALVSVLFVIVVCRLYLQATGAAGGVSVPHARGE
jgi:hypothetical protein